MNFYGYILVTSWIKPLHWSQVLCTNVVSMVFNRRKGFRAFSQPASVPRKSPFPEGIVEFSPSSVYLFSQILIKKRTLSFQLGQLAFLFSCQLPKMCSSLVIFYCVSLSVTPPFTTQFLLCGPPSHPSLHNLVLTVWPSQSPLPSQLSSYCVAL